MLFLSGCLLALTFSAPATGLAANTGTVAGKLTAMPLPPAARGVAELQAVRLDTGAIVGARRVGRSGAFTLTLPAGPYVLLGTVIERSPASTSASRS